MPFHIKKASKQTNSASVGIAVGTGHTEAYAERGYEGWDVAPGELRALAERFERKVGRGLRVRGKWAASVAGPMDRWTAREDRKMGWSTRVRRLTAQRLGRGGGGELARRLPAQQLHAAVGRASATQESIVTELSCVRSSAVHRFPCA